MVVTLPPAYGIQSLPGTRGSPGHPETQAESPEPRARHQALPRMGAESYRGGLEPRAQGRAEGELSPQHSPPGKNSHHHLLQPPYEGDAARTQPLMRTRKCDSMNHEPARHFA